MVGSPYWNPHTETLSREELDALQGRKLADLVDWTFASAPWQAGRLRAAGVEPGTITSLGDLRRIPFLTRQEWMAAQEEDPPYGPVLAAPRERAIRYHTTSGTSGRRPLAVLDSPKDWEWIPGGNMSTEARVRMLVETDATVVCSTPTYALRMAQEARRLGIDLPGSAVARLILSGEPAGSIPATKALIEEQWGAKAGDTAGMTEVGTIIMFECSEQPGGAHLIEDHYVEEVIDPHSGEPVGYGELGERVVTSFGRGFIPVLRYRTGDLVCRVPADRCTCGRGFDIYEGGIRGRADDMKVVRGTNVYPGAIEAIVRDVVDVEEFQVRLYTTEGFRDEIEVAVELAAERTGDERSARGSGDLDELGRRLAEAHEGLRFQVREAEKGSLPRFELKAKRLTDEREVWGGTGERKVM
jgi:phenylacetate-CoA ligase